MRPAVVGNQKDQYLVLVLLAQDEIDDDTQKLFFKSLRDYLYDPRKKEVELKESRVILNVSAIYQPEAIELDDLTRLFDTSKELRLPVRYLGENHGHALYSDSILGLGKGRVQSLDDVKTMFSVYMDLSEDDTLRQDFSVPGAPAAVCDGGSLRLSQV